MWIDGRVHCAGCCCWCWYSPHAGWSCFVWSVERPTTCMYSLSDTGTKPLINAALPRLLPWPHPGLFSVTFDPWPQVLKKRLRQMVGVVWSRVNSDDCVTGSQLTWPGRRAGVGIRIQTFLDAVGCYCSWRLSGYIAGLTYLPYHTIPWSFNGKIWQNARNSIMYIVHDEIKELDSKNSITMFVQQASKKVRVRQMLHLLTHDLTKINSV